MKISSCCKLVKTCCILHVCRKYSDKISSDAMEPKETLHAEESESKKLNAIIDNEENVDKVAVSICNAIADYLTLDAYSVFYNFFKIKLSIVMLLPYFFANNINT